MNMNKSQEQILMQWNELDEMRQDVDHRTSLVQDQRARWHKFIKKKVFRRGDWALLYDSNSKHFKGKFSTRWLGPYGVDEVFDNGSVRINTIDDEKTYFVVNSHWLKIYHKPLSHNQFLQEVQKDPGLELVHVDGQPLASLVE